MQEDRLITALITELGGPSVVRWQENGRYGLIGSFAGNPFDPPARLDFDLPQLVRHLDLTSAVTAFPHIRDPLRRAFVGFTVDLEGALATRTTSGSVLRLVDGSITIEPVRDPSQFTPDLPPDRYEWRAALPRSLDASSDTRSNPRRRRRR